MNNDSPDQKEKRRLTLSSEVLHGLFENGKSALSEQFLRWKLWKLWPEYVGPTIGAVSEPVGYKRGMLYVWVKNGAWMQQMIFMLEPMRAKINQKLEFEYVKEIQLTMDRRAVPRDAEGQTELKSAIQKLMTEGED